MYKIECICIANKTFTLRHLRDKLFYTYNSNGAIVNNSNSRSNSRKMFYLVRIEFHKSSKVMLHFNRTAGYFWNIFLA